MWAICVYDHPPLHVPIVPSRFLLPPALFLLARTSKLRTTTCPFVFISSFSSFVQYSFLDSELCLAPSARFLHAHILFLLFLLVPTVSANQSNFFGSFPFCCCLLLSPSLLPSCFCSFPGQFRHDRLPAVFLHSFTSHACSSLVLPCYLSVFPLCFRFILATSSPLT